MECENHICKSGIKVAYSWVQPVPTLQCLHLHGYALVQISKNKRHQDRTAALEVWERLEEFMRART